MKTTKIFILLILPLLLLGCSKNDDNSIEPVEMEEQLPQGHAYIPTDSNTIMMDLADGSIQNLLSGTFQTPLVVGNSVYYVSENSLIKASAIGGAVEWEYEFPLLSGSDNRFDRSNITFIDGFLYINFKNLDLTTFESTYYIQQISIDGIPGWTIFQTDTIRKLQSFNGNLITQEFIGPAYDIVVRKRDKNNGDVLNEYLNVEPVSKMYPAEDALIVVSQGNKIVSLNNSLTENWVHSTGLYNGVFGLVDQGNFIYYSYLGKVEAINLATGNLAWVIDFAYGSAKGLNKINGKYLAITVNDTTLDLTTLNPTGGDVESTITLTLEPNNQFDDFGISVFDNYLLFVQKFNNPSPPDPIFTMATLDGTVLWTKALADPFDTQWLLQTPEGSYYNEYEF